MYAFYLGRYLEKTLLKGCFLFSEWKEKVNIVDDESDDTVSYDPVTRFVFNPKGSGKLTMDEVVTIPHPMMTVSQDKSLIFLLCFIILEAVQC